MNSTNSYALATLMKTEAITVLVGIDTLIFISKKHNAAFRQAERPL